MTKELREYLIEETADAMEDGFRDSGSDLRHDIIVNGWRGLVDYSDQELMDAFLEGYESPEEFSLSSCGFDREREVEESEEYEAYWKGREASK